MDSAVRRPCRAVKASHCAVAWSRAVTPLHPRYLAGDSPDKGASGSAAAAWRWLTAIAKAGTWATNARNRQSVRTSLSVQMSALAGIACRTGLARPAVGYMYSMTGRGGGPSAAAGAGDEFQPPRGLRGLRGIAQRFLTRTEAAGAAEGPGQPAGQGQAEGAEPEPAAVPAPEAQIPRLLQQAA